MMKLLIQHNQALKRAARLIIAYEMRLGVISLADKNPLHPANTEDIHQEIKQALTAFHYWRKWRGENEPARAVLLQMWASGKWTNRDTCVRQCYRLAGFKNMVTARQALVGAPPPEPLAIQRQRAMWAKP
ncbi:hypothetical protein JD974_17120 [Chromobacterium haemolyticum]|uniref:Uncharacterized protein n=1 Tax=Chromobacterium haemolyticum TaxID=394935 RepID=A0ABS3GQM7_9NEIS|nr:hypothetical protein [Chromobacterium haemolyticum]MBK0416133.1 hypothetical protein [Chromobacterium haemolyticum]MBO0417329.1 hypothetical protein [Chromobacterium haemolyticum]MBO0500536.1 hypothetical protein [Chromobacterium haemolyticum]BBH15596.1 hypothetical protein CH06BL_48440 [Chromobacterium haemolyticum]